MPIFRPTIYPTLIREGDKLDPIPKIVFLIVVAPPTTSDQILKPNLVPSLAIPPIRADIPIIFKLFADLSGSDSCPVSNTFAVATPSGNFSFAFKIKARLRGTVNNTPSIPPIIAILVTSQASILSQYPMITKAGMVKITPAAKDSPADAAVCTILFSKIFEFRNNRKIPIDTIAAGIDAETVMPAYNPKYAIAAERTIERIILKNMALTVISFFIISTYRFLIFINNMKKNNKKLTLGAATGIGVGVGTALGVAFDNLSLGIALGVAIVMGISLAS